MVETIKDENWYRKELSDYSRRSYARGLVGGTGGNLSLRIPGTDTVLITPTGVSLADVEPDMNILVNLEGEIVSSPRGLKGSKETSFHIAAYVLRPDVMGIAHLHPPMSTAFANKGKSLPLSTISAQVILKDVPCVECFRPGSAELREEVIRGLKANPGIKGLLMKEHGILAMGPDIQAAYYLADLMEHTAMVAFYAAQIH